MEKHYDLIVSLIKAHRKYPDCESILDEIVADVYNHAEVVLNTVRNETVVASYLSKIVSTSMVTVPKRLGIVKTKRNDVWSRNVDNDSIATVNSQPSLTLTEQSVGSDKIEPESVDTDAISFYDEEDLKSNSDEILQIDDSVQPTTSLPENKYADKDVDKTLVDKMINGISENEANLVNNVASDVVDIDDIDSLDIVETNTEQDELAPVEELEEEPVELSETEDLGLNSDEYEEELAPVEELEEEPVELNETEDLDSSSDELQVGLGEETLELNEYSSDLNIEQYNPEAVSVISDEQPSRDIDSKPEIDNEFNDKSILSIYKAFEYDYEIPSVTYNISEYKEELQLLNSAYPNLSVLEVCKLKYEERLSINEISEKLNCTQKQVLDILGNVVNIVKD